MQLFISYSRTKTEIADILTTQFEAAGHEVVIDRRNLPYGEEWQKELAELIHASDTIVWLISECSINSSWCNWELGEAIRLGKRLVPVNIESVDPSMLPEELGKLHLLPATGALDLGRDLPILLEAIAINQDWLREHTRLSNIAREWKDREQNNDLLLRGIAIERAEQWSNAPPSADVSPTQDTIELIFSSRLAENRSLRRQRGFAVAFSFAALALMAVAISGAISATRQSKISDGLRFEAEVRAIATAEQRAVLLAALADQENSATNKLLIALEGWTGAGGHFPGFEEINTFQISRMDGQVLIEDIPILSTKSAPDYPQLAAILSENIDRSAETARFGTWEQTKYWDYQSGKLVLIQETGAMTIWSSLEDVTPLKKQISLSSGGSVKDLALSPDGALLALTTDKGDVFLLDAETGDTILHRVIGIHSLAPLSFSPDRRFLAFTVSDGQIGVADVADLSAETELDDLPIHSVFPGHERGTSAVQWNRSGRRIYTGGSDNSLAAWRLGLRFPVWRTEFQHPVTKISRSPDGTMLVAELRFGRAGLAVVDALTGVVRYQTDPRDEIASFGQAFALSEDGSQMIWGTRLGKVILTGLEGQEIWQTTCGTGRILRASFLQDGTRIAVSGDDGDLCIIDPNNFRSPILRTNFQDRGALDDLRELLGGQLLGLSFWGPAQLITPPIGELASERVAQCLDGHVSNQLLISLTERFALVISMFGFCIVDLDTGDVTFETSDANLAENGTVFAPSGTMLLTEVRGRAFLVEMADGEITEVTGIEDPIVGDIGYSHEGDMIFANHRNFASVAESDGANARTVPLSPAPETISYLSSIAGLIVLTTQEGDVSFYDRSTGSRLDVNDTVFPFSGTSFAAFELLSGDLMLGAVTLGNQATYWTVARREDGILTILEAENPNHDAKRWEGLVAFGRFSTTVADIASGRVVAEIPTTGTGDVQTALRRTAGDLIELRYDADGGTNLIHRVPLPDAVAGMYPRYIWSDARQAMMEGNPIDQERSFFVRLERQVNLAKQARELLDICLSPRERQRLGFDPLPPCWCSDVNYPTHDDWVVSLGHNPFEGEERTCQQSSF